MPPASAASAVGVCAADPFIIGPGFRTGQAQPAGRGRSQAVPPRIAGRKKETPRRLDQQTRSKGHASIRGTKLFRRRVDEKTKLLQSVPLFAELSRGQIKQIERLVTEVATSAGQRLATAGEYGKELVVIVEGQATVIVGRRRTVRLGPGDFWGEMSLVDGGPRSATVEADSDMRLLVVEGRQFSQLLQRAPLIAIKIMRVMSQRIRALEASASA